MIISDKNILTAKNDEVSIEEVSALVKKLEQELNFSALSGKPGIGLAAPQIGINKKVAIVRIKNTGAYDLSVNLVNAKISKTYDPFIFKNEGCLSFNDEQIDTLRFQEIYVTDNLVEPHSFTATGLMAVAIQHELDHLDGITFHQRINKSDSIKARNKLRPNDPCNCGKLDLATKKPKKYKKCCGA